MSHTRKKNQDKTSHLLEQEDKAEALEENAREFDRRTHLLKEKYKTGEKHGFFPKNIFSRSVDTEREIEPTIPSPEAKNYGSVKPAPKPVMTTQQRIDLFEFNLKKYKTTHPRVFSAGLRVMAQAYDLLETKLSTNDTGSLNRSLDRACELVGEPNQSTLDAVRAEAITALGHENKFKKYTGALLSLVGAIGAGIFLFIEPVVSLVGVGLFLSGAYLYKQSQPKSMSKALDDLANISEISLSL